MSKTLRRIVRLKSSDVEVDVKMVVTYMNKR